jgi:hypothetical protein
MLKRLLLLLVACTQAACVHLWVEPKDGLATLGGDLLVVIPGIERQPPPAIMINSKRMAAAWEAGVNDAAVCASVLAALAETKRFGRLDCLALASQARGWGPWPELKRWDWPWDIPLPAKGSAITHQGFKPPWVLVLDSLYIGYELRGQQNAQSPIIITRGRVAWWSNDQGRPVAWGDGTGKERPWGWGNPEDTTPSVATALDRLIVQVVERTQP